MVLPVSQMLREYNYTNVKKKKKKKGYRSWGKKKGLKKTTKTCVQTRKGVKNSCNYSVWMLDYDECERISNQCCISGPMQTVN